MTSTDEALKKERISDEARWARLKDIFWRAIELPAEKRADFVLRETTEDPHLRAEVLELVAHDLSSTNRFKTLAEITVRQASAADAILTPVPVNGLNSMMRWLLSEAEHRRYVSPFIADMEFEYMLALLSNRRWKARWIIVRGYWYVFKPFLRGLLDMLERLFRLTR